LGATPNQSQQRSTPAALLGCLALQRNIERLIKRLDLQLLNALALILLQPVGCTREWRESSAFSGVLSQCSESAVKQPFLSIRLTSSCPQCLAACATMAGWDLMLSEESVWVSEAMAPFNDDNAWF
jgi:hypothetical protein